MIRRTTLFFVLLSATCLALAPTSASADDFAPPPWFRGLPSAITAEWEFFTPADHLAPDGPLTNVFFKGTGGSPTDALITGAGGLGWGPGDGDGGWFFPAGGDILFTVDNYVDVEPVKHIWLQVTHTPGLGLGVDTLAGLNVGATGSFPGPVSMILAGPTHTLFYWDMFPNPPFETFRLLVFGEGEIDQVVVDTISVPEPSTFVLGGFGIVALGLVARRRKRRA